MPVDIAATEVRCVVVEVEDGCSQIAQTKLYWPLAGTGARTVKADGGPEPPCLLPRRRHRFIATTQNLTPKQCQIEKEGTFSPAGALFHTPVPLTDEEPQSTASSMAAAVTRAGPDRRARR